MRRGTASSRSAIHLPEKGSVHTFPINLALDPTSEQVKQRELDRGHFATPAEVVASALRLLNSQEDWLQENKEAINQRLELSFEQSRNGETYTPEQARQVLAERSPSRH